MKDRMIILKVMGCK